MNSIKKIFLVVGITVLVVHVEAAQQARPGINTKNVMNASNQGVSKNKQQPSKGCQDVISMDQIQQMQEMEQFVGALVVMVMIIFFKKHPKFISSLVAAYEKDPSTVEQKVVTQVQKYIKEQGDQVLNSILQEVEAGEDAQAMVQQVKPFIENILAHEIVKWVHVAAMSKIKI